MKVWPNSKKLNRLTITKKQRPNDQEVKFLGDQPKSHYEEKDNFWNKLTAANVKPCKLLINQIIVYPLLHFLLLSICVKCHPTVWQVTYSFAPCIWMRLHTSIHFQVLSWNQDLVHHGDSEYQKQISGINDVF